MKNVFCLLLILIVYPAVANSINGNDRDAMAKQLQMQAEAYKQGLKALEYLDTGKCDRVLREHQSRAIVSSSEATMAVVLKSDADIALESVAPILGHCVKDRKSNTSSDDLIAARSLAEFKGEKGALVPFTVNQDTKNLATAADMVAIDLLARTIFNEVGSQPREKCGDEYVRAVGKIIMNRRDFVLNDPTNAWKQFVPQGKRPEDSADQNVLTSVVLADKQFSVWDDGSVTRKYTLCPPAQEKQRYVGKNGKEYWTGKGSYELWKRSLQVAIDMVLRGEDFRKENADITSLFYTSGPQMKKARMQQGYQPSGGTISDKKINKQECIQAWDHESIDWRPPEPKSPASS